MTYYSTKVVELGSCAFRQPYATSHCKFLHGYRLIAKFTFACENLDSNNWVVDFGAVKELKDILEHQFDHTTVVWSKDPQLELFKLLNERGVIDLRVMDGGVGIEKFAEYCLNVGNEWVQKITNGRCWIKNVEVWEHEKNSAKVKIGGTPVLKPREVICEQKAPEPVQTKLPESTPQQEAKPSGKTPIPAPVGNKVETSNHLGFKGVLDGVKWGSVNPR